jgi:hypothetical protein
MSRCRPQGWLDAPFLIQLPTFNLAPVSGSGAMTYITDFNEDLIHYIR